MTVGIRIRARQAKVDIVAIANRPRDRAAQVAGTAGTCTHFYYTLNVVRRRFGSDGNGATNRIAAIERTLWTTQHFNLLNIKQLLVKLSRIRHQHAINQDSSTHFTVARLRYAANIEE